MPEPRRFKLRPKQAEFILSEAQFPCFAGGWASGKTLAGIAAVYKRCKENPRSLWLIGRRTYPDLRDSTLRDFLDLFGSSGTFEKSTYTFTLPNGSQVIFRHLDNIRSLTNINLSGFLIDQAEEVPEDVFLFLRGRLRRPGPGIRQGFLICNMEGHNWIWRLWKQEKTKLAGTHLVESTTYENADNLPADFLKQLETLPELVRKRYVMASWDVFEGQVFDEFDESIHVIDPFLVPREWFRFEGIDHGYTNPTSVHWYGADFDEKIFSYDEHYESKQLVDYHAKVILARRAKSLFGGEKQQIQSTYIDPSTRAENTEFKGQLTSVMKLYHRFGVSAIPAANDAAAGINLIKQFLAIDPKRIHPRTGKPGSPRLFFFRNCTTQIDEVRNLSWKKLRPAEVGHKNRPEEPVKANDHSVDDLKYVLLSYFGAPQRPKSDTPRNVAEIVERDLATVRETEGGNFELDIG